MFTRARLALAASFAAALSLTVVAIGLAAYGLARNDLDRQINQSLDAASDQLMNAYSFDDGDHPPPSSDNEDKTKTNNPPPRDPGPVFFDEDGDLKANGLASDVFVVVTDSAGTVQGNPRQIDIEGFHFDALVIDAGSSLRRIDVTSSGTRYRIATFPSPHNDGDYLHVGRSLEARDEQLNTLAVVFALGGLVGLVLSSGGGWWLAGRALVPIRRSLETQQRFVSDASHELRTPLAVVKANSELLLRHQDATIESNLDQVEAITVETDHMARLVEDLLTLARVDEGRANLVREEVDLGALLQEVGRDMGVLAELHDLTLDVDTRPVTVEADRYRLRQLAVILLDNALKYTPAGGRVTLRCQRSGRHAEFSVADTGPGIAPELQHRVFDRFYRTDSARHRAGGGTGLGLAIAQWIAEAHGGRITLESKPGAGATFTVRLPLE
jgi:two-component system sensor histidine kinase CiaH